MQSKHTHREVIAVRVNVDESALTDPRFRRLARYLEIAFFESIGRCVPVWMTAYNRRSATLTTEDVDIAADRDGFAAAMVRAELAEQLDGDRVRLRGVTERIQFLVKQVEKARKRWDSQSSAGGDAHALPEQCRSNAGGDAYSLDQDQSQDRSGSGSGSDGSARETRKPRTRGQRFVPGEWQPRAEDALLSRPQLEYQLAKFRDHEFPRAYTDWNRAWLNWQRTALERGGVQAARAGRAEPMHPSAYPDGDQEI